MYGKYTLFYESPKNWGYLRPCANSVYQTSPWGGGAWERSYVITCISALTIALIFLLNGFHLLDLLTLFTLA